MFRAREPCSRHISSSHIYTRTFANTHTIKRMEYTRSDWCFSKTLRMPSNFRSGNDINLANDAGVFESSSGGESGTNAPE